MTYSVDVREGERSIARPGDRVPGPAHKYNVADLYANELPSPIYRGDLPKHHATAEPGRSGEWETVQWIS